MSHRLDIVVQDDTWELLKRIPAGAHSRTINEALHEWAQQKLRRLDAVAEMNRLQRDATWGVTTTEIARWIREDRDGGH